ncbi:MAG: hypothetical protein GX306_01765 [Clostridiales bacterium]|nr:hypothetical protein [Clostridiales bacterium]
MPKKTVLDENAEIYQPRKELTEKEKLMELTPKKRLAYLWEYYRIHALVSIGIVALIFYIIYNMVTPNIETKFYAAIINNTISDEVIQEVTADLSEYLQLNPETETINLNTNFYFNAAPDYTMSMKQALTTFVAAAEVDVIIAPESEFESYAKLGFFDKLSDQLPTDLYSLLTDYFYISQLQEDPEKSV